MWFSETDAASLGRCLAQIGGGRAEVVELFFEDRVSTELRPDEPGPGVIERRDAGFAARLVRDETTYLATSDDLSAKGLERVLRDVARTSPDAPYRVPDLMPAAPTDDVGSASATAQMAQMAQMAEMTEMAEFPARLRRALRQRHASLRFRVRVRHLRRTVRVVGERLVSNAETQTFYAVEIDTPWGRLGRLETELSDAAVAAASGAVLARYRAREAASPSPGPKQVVLGAAAAAVFLHEAVAHALEADTLALTGRPDAAIGIPLGSDQLSVLDNPGAGPDSIARSSDDEGFPVRSRWLLREGVVADPLADRFAAARFDQLQAGSGRRGSRHLPPAPRSTHLELVPGTASTAELLAAGPDLYLPEVSRGRLDAVRGTLILEAPYGREVVDGELGGYVGACRIEGNLAEVLSSVAAVAAEAEFAGAGWCAKDGHLLPVWATCPALVLDGVAVKPPRGAQGRGRA